MTDDRRAILAAAERRAQALADCDPEALGGLLHPDFRWTSFRGEVFDRNSYVTSNTAGELVWHAQRLEEVTIVIAGDTGVLIAVAEDEVERDGDRETFRLRLTQTWVREADGWKCLAGHAGPGLNPGTVPGTKW